MINHGDISHILFNPSNTSHIPCISGIESFRGIFLYSIKTQQTIGYGTRVINEQCSSGIILLIIQTCFALLIQSLCVGLVYTKLSRPKKRQKTLMWSKQALIALRDGHLTFQCRLADMRSKSTLVEAHQCHSSRIS